MTHYPLPRIADIIDTVKDYRWCGRIDLVKAFWQIPDAESCKNIIAFATHSELWEYNSMPLGVKVNPGEFQKRINDVLREYLFRRAIPYLDDVILFGTTFEEFLQSMELILKRLQEVGFVLSPEKCIFAV